MNGCDMTRAETIPMQKPLDTQLCMSFTSINIILNRPQRQSSIGVRQAPVA
jgi:hypothetical protein